MHTASIALAALMSMAAAATSAETLTVATEGAYPPFNFIDANGELAGFDVEIAEALCADMGVECILVAVAWDQIIDGLVAGDYDVVVASLAYTEARATLIDFTEPYYRSYSAFVADPEVYIATTPEVLAGKRIATNKGTIQSEFLEKFYSDSILITTEDQPEAYRLLASGSVDLMMGDAIEQLSFLESPAGAPFGYVGDPVAGDFVQTSARIAVKKGNAELLLKINEALNNIRLAGTYDRINDAYFPFSIY